ncbi:MAG: hypothetical protein ACK5LX_17150 [Oscillospiraceae bacterium]
MQNPVILNEENSFLSSKSLEPIRLNRGESYTFLAGYSYDVTIEYRLAGRENPSVGPDQSGGSSTSAGGTASSGTGESRERPDADSGIIPAAQPIQSKREEEAPEGQTPAFSPGSAPTGSLPQTGGAEGSLLGHGLLLALFGALSLRLLLRKMKASRKNTLHH